MKQLVRFRKKLNEGYSPHKLNTIPDTVLRLTQFYSSYKKYSCKEISCVLLLTAPHFQGHFTFYDKFTRWCNRAKFWCNNMMMKEHGVITGWFYATIKWPLRKRQNSLSFNYSVNYEMTMAAKLWRHLFLAVTAAKVRHLEFGSAGYVNVFMMLSARLACLQWLLKSSKV